ncbi:TBC1 domain family member 31 isoform X1 [Schistocerca nitens]|uniref:TBC1 domain family member 31 isoform X1 n=1 Tax=Schistocerca nitens TaxID=7011 RepID=UPI0021173A83|nr:TBC1 domain family member 31 isoform X1 [Schistocerca nitens]
MNLDLKAAPRSNGVLKQIFQLKTAQKDGPILQIHHTIPGSRGESQQIRFVHIAFEDAGEKLAASDHRANIFIVDFASNKFWLLIKLDSCTCLKFSTRKKNELLVGIQNGSLLFVNTETGNIENHLDSHTVPVTQISFSQSSYCLSASSQEAFIWDLKSNMQIHKLSMREGVALKQIFFMPVLNHILACFQDDTIHIWKLDCYGNFECFKQIVPEMWKSHHIRCIAFTRNGRAMVIGCQSQTMTVISLDSWAITKVIQLPKTIPGVRHIEFLPQQFDGGCNKILCLLSSRCKIHFFNIDSTMFLQSVISPEDGIRHFTCSQDGKYLVTVLNMGEINVYKSSSVLDNVEQLSPAAAVEKTVSQEENVRHEGASRKIRSSTSNVTKPLKDKLRHLQKQMQMKLDLQQLKPILREFGEYPEAYRRLIWKTILQLPHNESAYVSLVNRDCHPAYTDIENQYPLENKSLLKHLKRLLSCLAHWCPLFGETKFLPLFVFPFIKVFQSDPVVCFESVVTIIINWCQRWFEYFPFPPVNVLTMIENVLSQQDNELMSWFYKHNITSQTYAWPLLEVAFSEVLSTSEWLQLWDHILSNEPSFLLIAVAAYNIVFRTAITSCKTQDDFEFFYRNQNPIDMKRFISKVYYLLETTSSDVHPRKYLAAFSPVAKDVYPVYKQYPTLIVDYKAQQMDQIRKEKEELKQKEEALLKSISAQEKKRNEEKRTEAEKARLQSLEEVYHDILQEEEDRVSEKRQKLAALRHELRMQKLEHLEAAREKLLHQQTQQRQAALDRLIKDIARKRQREEEELKETEEEIQWHYTNLLARKQELEAELASQSLVDDTSGAEVLQKQQRQLVTELAKLREAASDGHLSKQMDMANRIALTEDLLQNVETKIAKEVAQSHLNLTSVHNTVKQAVQLEAQAKALEEEVEHLVSKLVDMRMKKGHSKLVDLTTRQKEQNRSYEEYKNLTDSLLHQLQCSSSPHCHNIWSNVSINKQHAEHNENIGRTDSRDS